MNDEAISRSEIASLRSQRPHTPLKGWAYHPTFRRLQADNSEGPSLLGQPMNIRETHREKAATAGGLSRFRFYTRDSASENAPKPGVEL